MTADGSVATPDDALALAQERTGLTGLDSASWREGLAVVLDDLDHPSVTAQGRALVVERSVDALARRLQVHDYVQSHPEIRDETIERPLVVLGMPRTGTTVASYLLAQDPARRSLLHWEAIHPVPPATTETLRTDPRCLAILEAQQARAKMMEEARIPVPHWEDADGPTECMFVHDSDFKALVWDSFTPTTRYAEWLLREADLTSTYEYYARVLQVLQSTAPGTWSLKMPSHSVHVETLVATFPDVRMVWAHRDPFQATGSLCKLLSMPAGMVLGESVDKELIGRNAAMQMREHVIRPLRLRERIGHDRFFDLHYAETMTDPIGQMRRLYEWAGDPITPDVEQRMQTWLDANPQDRFGRSEYTLAEFGLSKEQLEPVFEEYLAAIDIELEGNA
jgi:hypothetical protein